MKKHFLIIISIFFLNPIFSQNGSYQGMGNASVMLSDFWSIFNNQAGLADQENPMLGICYNNGFLINETGTQAVGFLYPTNSGNFNASFSRYGYNLFSENTIGIGYSRKINELFSASVQFDYFYLHQSEAYENKSLYLFELGLIVKPADKLFIGAHLYNPLRAKIADYQNERIQTTMRLGLGYYFAENVVFTLETEKSLDYKLQIKSGLAYEIIDQLFIRAGIGTNPNLFSFGLGYQIQKLSFDLAFTSHPSLPISSQASLTYEF